LTAKDVEDPSIATAAAVRWLFHKRELASSYLKRRATWEEAVANYKSYLKKKRPFREQVEMGVFNKYLEDLKRGK
jgi:hypothetical protein